MTLKQMQKPSASELKSSVRRLDDWIESYLHYVFHTEPPVNFHRWTALGCVASALQRKVYMDWGLERIYPNLYIVLVGPAAQTRKSTALKIGESFVRGINIPMIGQDNSPEAVIREIKTSLLSFGGPNDQLQFQSAVTCFASELAVFLGRQNTEFQAYLTDWYDSPDEWKRTTKHQGIDDITGMCFNLVGAMAPDWIPHVFSPESIGGGFTSRIVFVSEIRKAKTISNPNKFIPPDKVRQDLLHDLEHIHTMVGAFKLGPDAEDFYVKWYEEQEDLIQDGVFPVKDQTFHHYCGRRATLLRKLSMVISASRSDSMVVELSDIQTALSYMEGVEKKLPGMFSAVGRSSVAHQLSLIANIIMERGEVRRDELLKMVYKDISIEDLEVSERTLEAAKLIQITREAGGVITYKWLNQ